MIVIKIVIPIPISIPIPIRFRFQSDSDSDPDFDSDSDFKEMKASFWKHTHFLLSKVIKVQKKSGGEKRLGKRWVLNI